MNENNNGNSRIRGWFRGLQEEFRKITWLDPRTFGRQTAAVIIVTVILAIIIVVIDLGIQHGVDFLVAL